MSEENIFVIGDLGQEANLQLADPNLVAYYKDLEDRLFWIDSNIDSDCYEFVQQIIRINREDRLIPVKDRKPIKFIIDSNGGSLDMAETMVSVIKLSKTPVYGYATGLVASAASLIYLACHKRYALPNAYFIFHKGSCSNMGGSYDEVQAAMEDYARQVEKMTNYYIDNTEYTEEEIRSKIQKDWYIYVTEALEKGVVTDLITDIDVF